MFCLQKKQKRLNKSCPHPSASDSCKFPLSLSQPHSRTNYCIIHFSWRAGSLDQIIDGRLSRKLLSLSYRNIFSSTALHCHIGTLLIACTWKWMNFSSSLFNYSWFLVAFVVVDFGKRGRRKFLNEFLMSFPKLFECSLFSHLTLFSNHLEWKPPPGARWTIEACNDSQAIKRPSNLFSHSVRFEIDKYLPRNNRQIWIKWNP